MKLDTLNEMLKDVEWVIEMVDTYYDIWQEMNDGITEEDIRKAEKGEASNFIWIAAQDFAYERINEGEGIVE